MPKNTTVFHGGITFSMEKGESSTGKGPGGVWVKGRGVNGGRAMEGSAVFQDQGQQQKNVYVI